MAYVPVSPWSRAVNGRITSTGRPGRQHDHFQGALPALVLDRAAGAEQHRRPDAHQARRRPRPPTAGAGSLAGPEQVDRQGRLHHRDDQRDARSRSGERLSCLTCSTVPTARSCAGVLTAAPPAGRAPSPRSRSPRTRPPGWAPAVDPAQPDPVQLAAARRPARPRRVGLHGQQLRPRRAPRALTLAYPGQVAESGRPAASGTPYASTSTHPPAVRVGAAAPPGVPRAWIRPSRDHRDPVAQLVGLGHVVRGQQHRGAGAASSATVCRSSRAATGSTPIDGSSRNSTSGPVQQPAGDVQPLPHAPRVALDPLASPGRSSPTSSSSSAMRRFCSRGGTPYNSAK